MAKSKHTHVTSTKGHATIRMGAVRGATTPAGRFRQNLRALIRGAGVSQKEASKKIGITYQRLRKLCGRGLARVSSDSREELRKICRFFGIKRTRLLWSPSLCATDRLPTGDFELDEYVEKLTWVWGKNRKLPQLRRALKSIDNAVTATVQILSPDAKDDDDSDTELGVRDRSGYDDYSGMDFEKGARAEFAASRRRRADDD